MRITYITAGAAGMYCGSCMHDNALARALSREGHDTILVPTYTPIRTDEKEVTVDQVFFGGINVFLQQKIPLFRLVPRALDRFLDSPWLIRKVTARAIETDATMLGGLAVSMLKGRNGNQKKEVRRLVDWISEEPRPDVIILSNILIAGFVRDLKKSFDVPVIVTLQGDDIFLESLTEDYRHQAIRLIGELDPFIDGYLVHSDFYAKFMSEYCGLNRRKMHVTPLGIDTGDFLDLARNVDSDPAINIGYLARLTSDKGLHHLVSAFVQLKKRDGMQHVKLKIAGWLGKDHEAFVDEQFSRLSNEGLQDHYEHLGSVDRAEKIEMLRDLDILCVPTEYREPKGLFALEAMACGIPVVQPAHGVFPEMLADLGGGLLFQPNDIDDLCNQLAKLVEEVELRVEKGRVGRESVLKNRNSQAMAQTTIGVIERVLASRGQ